MQPICPSWPRCLRGQSTPSVSASLTNGPLALESSLTYEIFRFTGMSAQRHHIDDQCLLVNLRKCRNEILCSNPIPVDNIGVGDRMTKIIHAGTYNELIR